MSNAPKKPTLRDDEITTTHIAGRRRALGLMAAGGTVLGLAAPAVAQATDADNGAWNDAAGCGRGPGGTRTGLTDADTGAISDTQGRGRGRPNC